MSQHYVGHAAGANEGAYRMGRMVSFITWRNRSTPCGIRTAQQIVKGPKHPALFVQFSAHNRQGGPRQPTFLAPVMNASEVAQYTTSVVSVVIDGLHAYRLALCVCSLCTTYRLMLYSSAGSHHNLYADATNGLPRARRATKGPGVNASSLDHCSCIAHSSRSCFADACRGQLRHPQSSQRHPASARS